MGQWQVKTVLPELTLTGNNALQLLDSAWTDRTFPLNRDRQGVAAKPDYDFTNMGLLFPQNDPTEIVYITTQVPHQYKLESDIYPHIHYVQDGASEPVWKLDYRWYKNGGDPTIGFTTITATVFNFTYVSGSLLQMVSWPAISGAGIDIISSMLDFKIYRDDNVVAGDILTKEFDFHYQIDSLGSRSELSK